jgi:hypothetical protein
MRTSNIKDEATKYDCAIVKNANNVAKSLGRQVDHEKHEEIGLECNCCVKRPNSPIVE